jgi:hypothetical protein
MADPLHLPRRCNVRVRKAFLGRGLAGGVASVALTLSPGAASAAGNECRWFYDDGTTALFYDGEHMTHQTPGGEFDYYQCQDGSWTLESSSD